MSDRAGQIAVGVVVMLATLLLLVFVIIPHVPPQYTFLFVIAGVVFALSFFKPEVALVVLVFSMLLSPEYAAGAVKGRSVTVRADDVFIVVIFLGWMARMAVNKELGLLRKTPLNVVILIYSLVCIISTLYGFLRGYVVLTTSAFYFLKYFEYFLVFFLVTNNLKTKQQAKRFIYLILFVGLIASVFAWTQRAEGIDRVSAPFEGKGGEANTLGGYLVLVLSIAAGILLNTSRLKERFFSIIFIALAFPVVLFTLSRGSWLSMLLAVIALFFLSPRGKTILFIGAMSAILVAPMIIPKEVKERYESTFVGPKHFQVGAKKITLDESASARIDTWRYGFAAWVYEPVLGFGVSHAGAAFDNQYMRVLIETGIVGIFVFLAMIMTIYKAVTASLRQLWDDGFYRGYMTGLMAGLTGLLLHSCTAATFIVIRIMEPFWFLVAIAVVLPELEDAAPALSTAES